MSDTAPFASFEDSRALAQAIVDTVREPLLVLDKDLRVIAASRSFYETFQADRQDTQGRLLYTLGDGQWVRGRAPLSDDRAAHHAAQCAQGVLRG
jgi:chemotaxis protein methyltransferase CheR